MRRGRRTRKMIMYVMMAALMFTTVAYAALQATLNINGTVTKKGGSWDIHFANLSEPTLTGDAAVGSSTLELSSFTFSASVSKPLDSIVYTFDVVNAGTIDAILDSITLTGKNEAEVYNIDYTLTYKDGTTIAKGDTLKSGQTRGLKLSVSYGNVDNILEEDIFLTLGATLIYIQATGSNQGNGGGSVTGEGPNVSIVKNYSEISNNELLDAVYIIESDVPISDYSKIILSDYSKATLNLSDEYEEGGKYKIKVGLNTNNNGLVSLIIEEGAYVGYGIKNQQLMSESIMITTSSFTGVIANCSNSCVNSGNTCTNNMIKQGILCKVVEQYNKETGETSTPADYYVLSDDGSNISLIKAENIVPVNGFSFNFSCGKRTAPTEAINAVNDYYQFGETYDWYITWNKFDYKLYIYEGNYGAGIDSPENVVNYSQQYARLPRYSEIYSNSPNIIFNSNEFLLSGYRYGFTDAVTSSEGSYAERDEFYTNKGLYSCGTYDESNFGLKPVIEVTKYRVLGQ